MSKIIRRIKYLMYKGNMGKESNEYSFFWKVKHNSLIKPYDIYDDNQHLTNILQRSNQDKIRNVIISEDTTKILI